MLTDADKQSLDARIVALESRTGVQVVTAVVPKADAYPELVSHAFALAASLAALLVVALDLLVPAWTAAAVALTHVLPVLAAGALASLGVVLVPEFARLFLRNARAAAEVRQYAQCLFLERDLCRTHARTAVLLLVARFERRVELVADRGHAGRVAETQWRTVVDAAAAGCARGDAAAALLAALDALEQVLVQANYVATGFPADSLPNATIEASAP